MSLVRRQSNRDVNPTRDAAISVAVASALFAAGLSYVMRPTRVKSIPESESSPQPMTEEIPDTVASEGSVSSEERSYSDDSLQETYPIDTEGEAEDVESVKETLERGAMTVETVVEVSEESEGPSITNEVITSRTNDFGISDAPRKALAKAQFNKVFHVVSVSNAARGNDDESAWC